MKQIEIHGRTFKFKNYDYYDYYCTDTICDNNNNVIFVKYARINPNGKLPHNWRSCIHTTREIKKIIPNGSLDGIYKPATEGDYLSLKTLVPDAMDDCTCEALTKLKESLSGDVAGFVCNRLKMSESELRNALAAEQIDSVAMAIYNIESRKMGMIIGDQTGVGKGRQAASIIRYGILNGYLPVFVTARGNLMSDIYRDCKALGIADKKPFIVNSDADVVDFSQKTTGADDVSDEDMEQRSDESDDEYESRIQRLLKETYKVVYTAGDKKYFSTEGQIPDDCSYVMTTYSQFNRTGPKQDWALSLAEKHNCIVVMDEAHKAAGALSATGLFFQNFLSRVSGCIYLSATYAKRPDNMVLYAKNTFMRQTDLSADDLMKNITSGSIPLQEVLSDALVRCGQMIRREHDNSGVDVEYIHLNQDGANSFGVVDTSVADRANMDIITDLMRRLIKLQSDFLDYKKLLTEETNNILYSKLERDKVRLQNRYEEDCGEIRVTGYSIFANIFLLVETLLLAIKSKSVALRAIDHVNKGKKVVICIAKTNEATIKNANVGDIVNGSFAMTLMPILRNLLKCKYTAKVEFKNDGSEEIVDRLREIGYKVKSKNRRECILERSDDFRDILIREDYSRSSSYEAYYEEFEREIKTIGDEIPSCPIDYMRYFLDKEKTKYGECTGRKLRLKYNSSVTNKATVEAKEKSDTSKLFDEFQRNKLDVLIINSTAATGASCHAIPAAGMKESEVKPRVMIIAQAELDVNTEVQKRGRVNRTGQIYKPSYEYLISDIPAENRMMLILRKKLASLDANTSSNKEQNVNMLDVRDLDNHYGDEATDDWAKANPSDASLLSFNSSQGKTSNFKTASGRIALLSCNSQEAFYDFVFNNYDDKITAAKTNHTYDLQAERLNYNATLEGSRIVDYGWGGVDFFGGNVIENTYKCKTENWALTTDAIKLNINSSFNADQKKKYISCQEAYREKFDETLKALATRIEETTNDEKLVNQLRTNRQEVMSIRDLIDEWLAAAVGLCDLPEEQRMRRCFGMIRKRTGDNSSTWVYCFFGGLAMPENGQFYTPGNLRATFYTADVDVKYTTNFAPGEDLSGKKRCISKILNLSFSSLNDPDFINTWNANREKNHVREVKKTIVTGNLMRGLSSPRYYACHKQIIKFSNDKGEWNVGLEINGDIENKISYPLTKSIIGHVLSLKDATLTGPIQTINIGRISSNEDSPMFKFYGAKNLCSFVSNEENLSIGEKEKLDRIFNGAECSDKDAKFAMSYLSNLHYNVMLYEHGINPDTTAEAEEEFKQIKKQNNDIWKKLYWNGIEHKDDRNKNEVERLRLIKEKIRVKLIMQKQKIDWANMPID